MKQLINYLKKYKFDTFGSIFLVTLAALTTLVVPKMIEKVINEGIMAAGGPNQAVMEKYGLIMIVIASIGLVAGVANSFFTARLSQNVGADMRNDGFKRVQEFSYQDVEKFKSQNLVVRLTNDIHQIQSVILLIFTTLLRAPILFVGSFILAMSTLPQLWYVIVILLVMVLSILAFVMKKMVPVFGKFQHQLDRLNGIIKENFEGARVVKSFVTEKDEEAKFDADNQKLAQLNTKIGHTFAVLMPTFMLVANVLTGLVIYLAADMAIVEPQTIGSAVSYINYLGQIMMALIVGGMVMMQFSRAIVSLKRFNEIMDTQPTISYPKDG